MDSAELIAEMQSFRGRIRQMEEWISRLGGGGPAEPVTPMNPVFRTDEEFWAEVLADNRDGSYQVRRMSATGTNVFSPDADQIGVLTVGNVPERSSYSGRVTVGDMVRVYFDGLDESGSGIYHIEKR
jgi:hypothetical protein